MNCVYDLFVSLLDPTQQYGTWGTHEAVTDLKSIPLASHVGECSRLVITEAARLLAVMDMDSHSFIRTAVLNAVVFRIHVLLHG